MNGVFGRRSGRQDVLPPGRYFISHSYADAETREALIARLPAQAKPYIFPPITVEPDEFVSNALIAGIKQCDGVIYLRGGHSARSFWVAFERDYALRAGKPVYAYDPASGRIIPHEAQPPKLPSYIVSIPKQYEVVYKVAEFMMRERSCQIWASPLKGEQPSGKETFEKVLRPGIDQTVKQGGYVLVFWSRSMAKECAAPGSLRRLEIEHARQYNHALFILLDKTPLPPFWQEPCAPFRTMPRPVVLYNADGLSRTNRMDDIIVRLCWLVYRDTQQLAVS